MKRIVFALVAGTTLVLPAAAQQSPQTQPPSATPMEPQQHSQSQSPLSGSQAASQQPISSKDLTESQIRNLQQALNEKGYSPGDVDGIWGPETRDALENFKKAQGISSTEPAQLDDRTLQALGLDMSSSGTTGMGGSSNQPAKNNDLDQVNPAGPNTPNGGGRSR